MREHNRDKERLEHILDAISVIDTGLATYSKEELLDNKLLYYGLVKQSSYGRKTPTRYCYCKRTLRRKANIISP